MVQFKHSQWAQVVMDNAPFDTGDAELVEALGVKLRDGIRVISIHNLTRDTFETEYLELKVPVIITGCMESWKCYREWTLDVSEHRRLVHLEVLAKVFKNVRVPVINMSNGEKSTVLMEEYCSDRFWESGTWKESEDKLYLKDFHFCIEAPWTLSAYETPEYFLDDWMNTWFDSDNEGVLQTFGSDFKKSDYKFLYFGPQQTSTSVHTDVIHSHSWSAQLAGRKQWKLLNPSYSSIVENHNGICISESLSHCKDGVATVTQYPGEIIYVPSGWYHQVLNLDNSLSINHNWIDSSSLKASWQYLIKEYDIAARMIEDCRPLTSPEEFKELVSSNVLRNCGFHRESFLRMVTYVLNHASPPSTRIGKRRQYYGREFAEISTL